MGRLRAVDAAVQECESLGWMILRGNGQHRLKVIAQRGSSGTSRAREDSNEDASLA